MQFHFSITDVLGKQMVVAGPLSLSCAPLLDLKSADKPLQQEVTKCLIMLTWHPAASEQHLE